MATYYYLSLTPEALVASMLPPAEFGTYLAVGTRKRSSQRAMVFDLKSGFRGEGFDLSAAFARCVPRGNGTPKHSVYLAIYRVLERVPLAAINSLWLITRDGRTLELKQGTPPETLPGKCHLYQEICPVHPLVASSLPPADFCSFITNTDRPVSVPRLCFVELELAGLADEPGKAPATDLPYGHLDHLRECLVGVSAPGKHTKIVDRIHPEVFPHRCVKSGFYLGDAKGLLYYPFPSQEQLDAEHHDWYKSATNV